MHYSIVNIIMFFLIYGFLGFLAESIFRSIAEKRLFISRAFLTNGFCPLYGLCGILIVIIFTLCELTINNTLWALILATVASIITVTFLEYIVGRVLDRVFNCKLWDYSSYYLNLHSYICVEFSLLWGIVAIILSNFIHPAMEVLVYAIPYEVRNFISTIGISILFVNASYNLRQRYPKGKLKT
ncbi:MAG: putative ABC transporter permease [Tissierellia bacterium]|nr:putative ABC transporter permease [Tissierellia bacterium]